MPSCVVIYSMAHSQPHCLSLLPSPGHALGTLGLPVWPFVGTQIYKRTLYIGIFNRSFKKRRHRRDKRRRTPPNSHCKSQGWLQTQKYSNMTLGHNYKYQTHISIAVPSQLVTWLTACLLWSLFEWKLFWTSLLFLGFLNVILEPLQWDSVILSQIMCVILNIAG